MWETDKHRKQLLQVISTKRLHRDLRNPSFSPVCISACTTVRQFIKVCFSFETLKKKSDCFLCVLIVLHPSSKNDTLLPYSEVQIPTTLFAHRHFSHHAFQMSMNACYTAASVEGKLNVSTYQARTTADVLWDINITSPPGHVMVSFQIYYPDAESRVTANKVFPICHCRHERVWDECVQGGLYKHSGQLFVLLRWSPGFASGTG